MLTCAAAVWLAAVTHASAQMVLFSGAGYVTAATFQCFSEGINNAAFVLGAYLPANLGSNGLGAQFSQGPHLQAVHQGEDEAGRARSDHGERRPGSLDQECPGCSRLRLHDEPERGTPAGLIAVRGRRRRAKHAGRRCCDRRRYGIFAGTRDVLGAAGEFFPTRKRQRLLHLAIL